MTISTPLPEHLPALRCLWQEAFEDTQEFWNTFFSTAFSPDHCRMILADGQIAAALYLFDCEWSQKKAAYLYAVATKKSFRSQGLCHRLMDDTHRHLNNLGYAGTLLVPGSLELFRFYEDMGYQTFSYLREHNVSLSPVKSSCSTTGAKCPQCGYPSLLTPISVAEYAALRRSLLPTGSVLQEGASLAFLTTQATLYKSNDSLLAARREGRHLQCIELLGNSSDAVLHKILSSLGCTEGLFRTPGTSADRPFAMYRPFPLQAQNKTGELTPTYFGLAFD